MSEQAIYRLRAYDKIVGYSKTIGRFTFYSKDRLWWNGNTIAFTCKERQSEWNNQYGYKCFVNDIIALRDDVNREHPLQVIEKDEALQLRYLFKSDLTEIEDLNARVHLLFAGLPSRTANKSLFKQIIKSKN